MSMLKFGGFAFIKVCILQRQLAVVDSPNIFKQLPPAMGLTFQACVPPARTRRGAWRVASRQRL